MPVPFGEVKQRNETESLREARIPVKRIRDGKRYIVPKEKIPYEDWQEIEEKANRASLFLAGDNPVSQMMWRSTADLENAILENKIGEEREETLFGTVKRIIIHDKKTNIDEAIGKLKYLRSFFAELKTWVDFKINLEHQEAEGALTIERVEKQDEPETV